MKQMFVYITTNSQRTVLYVGVTNDLQRRMAEHYESTISGSGFTGKYKAHHLIYFEEFDNPLDAIAREKQLKGQSRAKKEALIASVNPNWTFLEMDL
jgi:putative endonuclease